MAGRRTSFRFGISARSSLSRASLPSTSRTGASRPAPGDRRRSLPSRGDPARAGRRRFSGAGRPQALDGASLRVADWCAGIHRGPLPWRACTPCAPTQHGDDREAGSDLAAAADRVVPRAPAQSRRHGSPSARERDRPDAERGVPRRARSMEANSSHAVDEQREAHHLLRFDVTGPWAAYDFVRMQFGS